MSVRALGSSGCDSPCWGRTELRIPSHTHRADISENMMTPMIDVVFNLLIFFVCASALNIQELSLRADLGVAKSEQATAAAAIDVANSLPADEVRIELSVRPGGQLVMRLNGVDHESFSALKELLLELAQLAPGSPVVLDVEGDVEAGEVLRVYDTCRAARFQSIQFALDPASTP
jgi:biopolymer transport protein ExbD